MLPATVLTLAALGLLLWAEARDHAPTRRIAKPIASTGFILVALAAGAMDDAYGQAILAGLVLSWVGDVCLLSPRNTWFLAGLSSFLLAHVAFGGAFVVEGPAWGWVGRAALPLVAIAWLVRRWLTPYVPSGMRRPVDAYIVVITAMVALSIGATMADGSSRIAIGAIMFFLSDLSVAQDRFIRRRFVTKLWGLPMYYGAQLVLASSIGH